MPEQKVEASPAARWGVYEFHRRTGTVGDSVAVFLTRETAKAFCLALNRKCPSTPDFGPYIVGEIKEN